MIPSRLHWKRLKTASVKPVCPVKKPSVLKPGKFCRRNSTQQETVKGYISGKVKGGFTVSINNTFRASCRAPWLYVRPVRDVDHLEGKELDFKLIKLDPKRNNIVVSRRAVLQGSQQRSARRASGHPGRGSDRQEVTSRTSPTTVRSSIWVVLTACMHITDMAWKRISHPRRNAETRAMRSLSRSSSSTRKPTVSPSA